MKFNKVIDDLVLKWTRKYENGHKSLMIGDLLVELRWALCAGQKFNSVGRNHYRLNAIKKRLFRRIREFNAHGMTGHLDKPLKTEHDFFVFENIVLKFCDKNNIDKSIPWER